LIRAEILHKLQGFDEQFFMYGEDIDLAFRIKELGYKIIYYPSGTVTHLKYQSGLGGRDKATQQKIHHHFYDAMKIFYRKHYASRYPSLFNTLMYGIIDLKEKLS
jgi:GT2 family glycosyltransferase